METKKVQEEETRTEHTGHSTQEKRKEEIEKKGTLAKNKEQSLTDSDKKQPAENDLTKEDIPDSTNESTGVPGSGQRQDSN
jgi:archaellum component FlaC